MGDYLGLSSLIGWNKNQVFSFIKEWLSKRILKYWKNKLLSRVGKEVVNKMVAQAIPVYSISVFLLPHNSSDDLQKMMNSF